MRYALIMQTAAAAAALTAASLLHAAENEVVVVPMTYGDGVYFRRDAPVRILPCEPPNLPVAGGGVNPRVEGLANNERVFSKQLRDPRLKLVEDPTADNPSERVTATDFTLYLPWTNEYTEVRFFSDDETQEANVVVDLSAAISAYRESGGRDQEATCQYPERLRANREAIDLDARIDQGLSEAEQQDGE